VVNLSEILGEVENECEDHTLAVVVKFQNDGKLTKQVRIIGGILRVLAEHTDGFCATDGADDPDLIAPSGMVFHFIEEKRQRLFIERIKHYLRGELFERITATNIN